MAGDDNGVMDTPTRLSAAGGATARLTHWGLIRAEGPDAVAFLQGQLTNDVATLAPGQWRLAGFCSAKGRLQASFVIWKTAPDALLLACASSVLPATLKRLGMFILRSKCKLVDASAELALYGSTGEAASAAFGELAPGEALDRDGTQVLRLPDVENIPRAFVAAPAARAPDAALPLEDWRWLEVRSGLPLIEAATVDRFVPQMLNYELIGGVDFRKGCYPGQEVVARSQYRGTIKRRMFLFECGALAVAGQDVFHDSDPEQPAGMVVNAAAREGHGAALVEVKLAALGSGRLHLGSPDGEVLRLATLPYPVPSEAGEIS